MATNGTDRRSAGCSYRLSGACGGYDERGSRAAPAPGAPQIRIRCYGLLGRHTVWRLPEELQSLPYGEARKAARELSRQLPGQLPPPAS